MFTDIELRDIKHRTDFYNKKSVARMLLAAGIPKTKAAMLKLIGLEDTDGSAKAIQDAYDCLTKVSFTLHPQQINIRDKINGSIIASIAR